MEIFSRFTARASFTVALMLCVLSVHAADDEYLKMLEGEAEDLRLDSSGQINDAQKPTDVKEKISETDWKWEGDLEGDKIPAGLSQEQFSSLLEKHFYGTYVFYRKLSSVDRNTVYYHYSKAETADLDAVRQDILSQLKN